MYLASTCLQPQPTLLRRLHPRRCRKEWEGKDLNGVLNPLPGQPFHSIRSELEPNPWLCHFHGRGKKREILYYTTQSFKIQRFGLSGGGGVKVTISKIEKSILLASGGVLYYGSVTAPLARAKTA